MITTQFCFAYTLKGVTAMPRGLSLGFAMNLLFYGITLYKCGLHVLVVLTVS